MEVGFRGASLPGCISAAAEGCRLVRFDGGPGVYRVGDSVLGYRSRIVRCPSEKLGCGGFVKRKAVFGLACRPSSGRVDWSRPQDKVFSALSVRNTQVRSSHLRLQEGVQVDDVQPVLFSALDKGCKVV